MLCHEEEKNEAAKQTICCFKNSTLFSWTFSGSTKRKATINYPYNTFPEARCVFSEHAAVEAPDDAVL